VLHLLLLLLIIDCELMTENQKENVENVIVHPSLLSPKTQRVPLSPLKSSPLKAERSSKRKSTTWTPHIDSPKETLKKEFPASRKITEESQSEDLRYTPQSVTTQLRLEPKRIRKIHQLTRQNGEMEYKLSKQQEEIRLLEQQLENERNARKKVEEEYSTLKSRFDEAVHEQATRKQISTQPKRVRQIMQLVQKNKELEEKLQELHETPSKPLNSNNSSSEPPVDILY